MGEGLSEGNRAPDAWKYADLVFPALRQCGPVVLEGITDEVWE